MGIFINRDKHPDVFKSKDKIKEPNQEYSKIDYVSELVKEQKKANFMLSHSIGDLKNLFHDLEHTRLSQWKEIDNQLFEIKQSNQQHNEYEIHIQEWLTKLDEKNMQLQSMLENEGRLNQQMLNQIQMLGKSNLAIVKRIGIYESLNEELTLKINEQLEWQNELSEQMIKQESIQTEVLNRLDQQEALTEKLLRQMNHIRSILFERTNYLAGKIEKGYKLTSSYVYKLMTGTHQPLTITMMNPKNNEDQKDTE